MESTIALLGFGVGLLVGFTGMGSGALMTPILILVLRVSPVIAVGSDLAYAAITKLVGAYQHIRQGTVDLRTVGFLALGSIPGGLMGVQILSWYEGIAGQDADVLVRRTLGGALLLAGLVMLLVSVLNARHIGPRGDTLLASNRGKLATIATGAFVGTLVGLTSVGSGSLLMPFLFFFFRFPASRLVGTDVSHGALLITAAALAHGAVGNVDVLLVTNLLIGSIPGILIGSHLTLRVPEPVLRPILASVLMFTGFKLV